MTPQEEEQKRFDNHPGWQWCTWEGAELHTLLIGLQTTFREKLEWLEEAETLTLRWREQREGDETAVPAPSPSSGRRE